MARYKIVFTDYYYPNNDQEVEILQRLGDVEILDCTRLAPGGVKAEDSVLEHARDADALIVQFAAITRKVISGLTRCRIISRYAIGVDNIDVEAARARAIVVANVPDYCIEEVSDTALAHILNCVRKLSLANELLHASRWHYEALRPLHRLSGLTVGLVAFGNIARRVAEKLRVFGVHLLVFDPYFDRKQQFAWVEFVSFEELLERADIVTIHAPQSAETHHLIDHEAFGRMKEGVILVNTSRGALVDERALAQALESGKVALAGLDVLDCQDADYAKSLLMRYPERVFVSPHMGWYSEESVRDLQRKTALNVYELLAHGRPLYSV
jgi:D-3-phosphoglycerate dehydrogenase